MYLVSFGVISIGFKDTCFRKDVKDTGCCVRVDCMGYFCFWWSAVFAGYFVLSVKSLMSPASLRCLRIIQLKVNLGRHFGNGVFVFGIKPLGRSKTFHLLDQL